MSLVSGTLRQASKRQESQPWAECGQVPFGNSAVAGDGPGYCVPSFEPEESSGSFADGHPTPLSGFVCPLRTAVKGRVVSAPHSAPTNVAQGRPLPRVRCVETQISAVTPGATQHHVLLPTMENRRVARPPGGRVAEATGSHPLCAQPPEPRPNAINALPATSSQTKHATSMTAAPSARRHPTLQARAVLATPDLERTACLPRSGARMARVLSDVRRAAIPPTVTSNDDQRRASADHAPTTARFFDSTLNFCAVPPTTLAV
jgi:hypothetical protein